MAILKILLLGLMLLLNACMYYPHHLYEGGYGRSYYDRGYGNYHENHYHGNGSHGYGKGKGKDRGRYHGNWQH
ncbi:MAG: hypothetical protein PHG00_12600 [Methylococcales bacterium]|nr:hypothetical protein [Methylococcales bacterium]